MSKNLPPLVSGAVSPTVFLRIYRFRWDHAGALACPWLIADV